MSNTITSPVTGSGISGDIDEVVEFAKVIARDGAVVVQTPGPRTWNHYVIGVGVGHDDARFAETGSSHAAYVENRPGGWWDGSSVGRHYGVGA